MDKRNDIVFWAHGHNETERFIPLSVGLNKRGIRTLIFYQNFDYHDGLSDAQQKIINKYGLNITDYSGFINNPLLILVSFFVKLLRKKPKLRYFYNKTIGLRSKILKRTLTNQNVYKILASLNPRISFFDTISLTKYTDYPYGSYFIKNNSDKLKIKTLSIHHGGTGHLVHDMSTIKKELNYDTIYTPNQYENDYFRAASVSANSKIKCLGDPRFDNNWKKEIKDLLSPEVKKLFNRLAIKNKSKFLYLCPNLEHIGEEDAKYKNIGDVIRLSKTLNNIFLLIKPHPRYRNEHKIRKLTQKNNFKDFFILPDDPLVCYLPHIDYLISLTSSALHDALPDDFKKIIIYDNFSETAGITNIFKDNFNYFNEYSKLLNFFIGKSNNLTANPKQINFDIMTFCEKWVGADKSTNAIIDRICNDICKEELERKG